MRGPAAACRLHGHNYTVGVRLEAEGVQHDGYVVDFGDIKKVARKLCKDLNELFLCPERSDVMQISTADGTLTIKWCAFSPAAGRLSARKLPTTTLPYVLILPTIVAACC